MAQKTVYWYTGKVVCCGEIPSNVFLCTIYDHTIAAVLLEAVTVQDTDCNKTFKYKFSYDEDLLEEGAPDLTSDDIESVLCDGCYVKYVNEQIAEGVPAAISEDDENLIGLGSDDKLFIQSDGWIPVSDTWAYSSATRITIPTGGLSKYRVGDKIKLVQTTTKYFYVMKVADAYIDVYGGTTYVLANAAITGQHYSHQQTPVDFPDVFTLTGDLTIGGFGGSPPTVIARFAMNGRRVLLNFQTTVNGTSTSTAFTVTLPAVLSSSVSGPTFLRGANIGYDNGSYQNNVLATLPLSSQIITLKPQGGSANWTASGAKGVNFNLEFTIDNT